MNKLLLWNEEDKDIDYNKELYKKYNKESIHENVRRIIPYSVGCCDRDTTILKPKRYNEEEALRCGLMPFKYMGSSISFFLFLPFTPPFSYR